MGEKSKTTKLMELQALITGVPTYCPSAVLMLDGQSIPAAELVQMCDALVAAETTTRTAKAAYQGALADERELFASEMPVVDRARKSLLLMHESSPTVLTNLGITPPKKRTPLTPEALVVRAAKGRATRVARGTKGPKQRLLVKGNVVGVTVAPTVKG